MNDDSLALANLQQRLLQLLKQFGDFYRGLANISEEGEKDLENILEDILSELSQVKQRFHEHIENLKPVTVVERNAQSSQIRLLLLESHLARVREHLQNLIREQERELQS
jgi:signal transduction histidine kinase